MRWTQDRLDWLIKSKEIYDDREDILKAFNEHFNLNVSLSLLTKNNGRYKLSLPKAWKLLRKNAEITQVKRRGFYKRPNDYEQTYIKDNVVYMRTNETVKYSRRKDGFVPKNRYLYEQYHGVKLDDIDDVIIFLDDDYTNFSKENLYRLPRKTHALYLNHGLHKVNSVDKLTLIKYCEWKEKIFNLKRKGGRRMKKLLLILVVILTALGVTACQAPEKQTNELETYDYYLLVVVSRQRQSQGNYSYVLREVGTTDNITYESDELWSVGEFVIAIELDEEGNVYYTDLDATTSMIVNEQVEMMELYYELKLDYYEERYGVDLDDTPEDFVKYIYDNYRELYDYLVEVENERN